MADKPSINVEVTLRRVRLSYPHLYRPQESDDPNGKPAWGASFIIPDDKEGDKIIRACEDAIAEAKQLKWGNNQPRIGNKVPLKDGNDARGDEYQGHKYVQARAYKRPEVLHNRRDPETGNFRVLQEDDNIVYAGCYVNAVVRFYGNTHPKRGDFVACSLEAIQYAGEGEAFGPAKIDAHERFKDFEDTSEERDMRESDGRRSRSTDRDSDRGRDSRGDDDRRGGRDDRGRDRDERSRDRDRADDPHGRGRDDDRRQDRDRDSGRGGREEGREREGREDRREDRGRSRDDDRGRDHAERDRGRRDDRDGDRDRGLEDDRRDRDRGRDDVRSARDRENDRGNDRGRGRFSDDGDSRF